MHRFLRLLSNHRAAAIAAVLIGALLTAVCVFIVTPLRPLSGSEEVIWSGGDSPAEDHVIPEGWTVFKVEDGVRLPLEYTDAGCFEGLNEGQVVYASHPLTLSLENPMIEFNCEFPLIVFLNDEIIYAGSSHLGSQIGDLVLPGGPSFNTVPLRVPLPDGYAGSTLTAAWAPVPEEDGTIYFGPVTLYSFERFASNLSSESMQAACVAAMMAVLAALLAAVYLFGLFHNQADAGALCLCLFCCTLVLDAYLNSWQTSVYFDEALQNWICFRDLSVTLLLLFIATRLGRFRRPTFWFAAVQGILTIAAGLYSVYNGYSSLLAALPAAAALAALIFCLGCGILQARAGNGFARLFLIVLGAAFTILVAGTLFSALHGGTFAANLWLQVQIVLTDGLGSAGYVLYLLQWLLVAPAFVGILAEFIRGYARRRYERTLLEQHLEMAQRTGNEIRQCARQTAMHRHDMKRHLTMIDQFLQTKDYEGAQNYLQEIGASLGDLPHTTYSGNTLLDIILNAKLSEAGDLGLNVTSEIARVPASLPLSDAEVSSLMLNTLDNAIRAAAASPDRQLDIRLYVKGNYLCYQCSNSVADEPRTERREGHGYGIKIIEQIVERHEGLLDAAASAGRYRLLIAMPVRPDTGLSNA